MNISRPFIERPVATTLLTAGLALAGLIAFTLLPVAPLPSVDSPVIFVSASMSGASPETMATSVATPLERHLGAIAGVEEMTSSSSQGSARITLEFDMDRDIEGAARDVQAAINAARADLPAAMKGMPSYRKMNPNDMPVLILGLTSDKLSPGQIYDAASTVLQQKLSQISGIGQVQIGGSSLPAVRVEIDPQALFHYGIGLESVRAALSAANANAPKGVIDAGGLRYTVTVNDQSRTAAEFSDLVIAYRDGAAVRLHDVAKVYEGVEDDKNFGMVGDKPAILVMLTRQPGANIIDTVERVKASLPKLRKVLPSSIAVSVVNDRSTSIRASVRDVELTMIVAVALVVLVVFLFLRNGRAALIPSVAVPLSLIGTFIVMYAMGFSLDNLSLMALTIATGFVVDDAIVVLENVTRHIEAGMSRFEATVQGAREVGFTVVAMSLSLVAVFLPILLMGGMIGRFFQEFSITLAAAILISLVISLTTTPMMCAHLRLHKEGGRPQGRILAAIGRMFDAVRGGYGASLTVALRHPLAMVFVLAATVVFNVYLFLIIPSGWFPHEDTGGIMGRIRGDQTISFQAMRAKFKSFVHIVNADPAVQSVVGFMGGGGGPRGGGSNSASAFVQLKPLSQRPGGVTTEAVAERLNEKLQVIEGARANLFAPGNMSRGGRTAYASYQYTILGDSLSELNVWAPKIASALEDISDISNVNTDRDAGGLEIMMTVDREAAKKLGVTQTQIDSTLYDAFGQRAVSTIYNDMNQYSVVMSVSKDFWQSPETLKEVYVSTSGGSVSGTQSSAMASGTVTTDDTSDDGTDADVVRNQQQNALVTSSGRASTAASVSTSKETMVPLAAFAHFEYGTAPLSVNHQGPFVASTISFNLPQGKTLGEATAAINRAIAQVKAPISIHGEFAGTARMYRDNVGNVPVLVIAAIITVYIVLGILYESLVHPLTILSTLPSAGVGALLALRLNNLQLDLMGIIGILLLIGIVKKNAIMMIDFALDAERTQGLDAREAIYKACLMRFRPIMMTTFAAILGALPLAIGFGTGGEMRKPLGIAIVGGLVVSQVLTLYTTPVIYLYLDRFRLWSGRKWNRIYGRLVGEVVS